MTLDPRKIRRLAAVAGSQMSYIDVGAGDTVVLAHDYLCDAEMWRAQIDALSKHYRVIIPELWGHGKSGRMPCGTKDLSDIAYHHLVLLDHLGVRDFALIGLSAGGMWAAELALMVPQQVTGLALLDSYVGPEQTEDRERYLSILAELKSRRALSEHDADAIVPWFFSPETIRLNPLPVRNFKARLLETKNDRTIDTLVAMGRIILNRRNALPDLADLAVPAIVMTGQHDHSHPPEEGWAMAKALSCMFIELRGAGHLSSIEAPEDVTRHLLGFLAHLKRDDCNDSKAGKGRH